MPDVNDTPTRTELRERCLSAIRALTAFVNSSHVEGQVLQFLLDDLQTPLSKVRPAPARTEPNPLLDRLEADPEALKDCKIYLAMRCAEMIADFGSSEIYDIAMHGYPSYEECTAESIAGELEDELLSEFDNIDELFVHIKENIP